jgi:hypothetical protein
VGVTENRVDLQVEGTGFRDEPMSVTRYQEFHPQWLHHRLTENSRYRKRFGQRVESFLSDGLFSAESSIRLFDARVKELALAIIGESARWGDAQESATESPRQESIDGPFTKNDHWLPMLERIREEFFAVRTDIVIEQLQDANLYP